MLFVLKPGQYIEINRSLYLNDIDYYREILKIKGFDIPAKSFSPEKRIASSISFSKQ